MVNCMALYDIKMIPKVVIIGEPAVGKTSLCNSFLGKPFSHAYLITVGVDFFSKDAVYDLNGLKVLVSWQIWDLAGDYSYHDIIGPYYIGSDTAAVVYDITRRDTLEKIRSWIFQLWEKSGQIPIVIVGNKKDLRNETEECVAPEEGQKFAEELNKEYEIPVYFIETSAKTGENVEELFKLMFKAILWKKLKEESEEHKE